MSQGKLIGCKQVKAVISLSQKKQIDIKRNPCLLHPFLVTGTIPVCTTGQPDFHEILIAMVMFHHGNGISEPLTYHVAPMYSVFESA